jgi:hypothetical protein
VREKVFTRFLRHLGFDTFYVGKLGQIGHAQVGKLEKFRKSKN